MACCVGLAILVVAVFLSGFEAGGESYFSCDNSVIVDPSQHLPCRCPQPRAFKLSKFVDLAVVYKQAYVVLHRCNQAGCCPSDEEDCVATNKTKIEHRFRIYGRKREPEYGTVTLDTDLACECRKSET